MDEAAIKQAMAGQPQTQEQAAQMQEKQQAQEMQRQQILDQILLPEARDRLKRLGLVKEAKARGVEDMLIQAAKSGQLKNRVDEARLLDSGGSIRQYQRRAPIVGADGVVGLPACAQSTQHVSE